MSDSLSILRGASDSSDPRRAAAELYEAIAQPEMALVIFYCSSEYELPALGRELDRLFGDTLVIGCTTAGEIGPAGYLRGSLSGVSISSSDFHVACERLDNLSEFEVASGEQAARELVVGLEAKGHRVGGNNAFGFLLVDGMSMKEEPVVSSLYRGLGDIQMFGGSAGDGEKFGTTYIYHDGEFHTDCAVFTLVHTERRPFKVFKTQHFVSSDDKMVVTEADPARRIVTEINGEPAGREYARMVGLAVDKLTPMIFATYPVVVKVGGNYFVRSIQKVNEDESLTFFCAIDEGIVLTVARGVDLVENLDAAFNDVREAIGKPELIIGCDCILRHLEMDRRGIKEDVAELMAANSVIGFSTYGEQYNAMHVNQTFTGVAIGTPRTGTDG